MKIFFVSMMTFTRANTLIRVCNISLYSIFKRVFFSKSFFNVRTQDSAWMYNIFIKLELRGAPRPSS